MTKKYLVVWQVWGLDHSRSNTALDVPVHADDKDTAAERYAAIIKELEFQTHFKDDLILGIYQL